ncbi:isopentenyl-diphosphate delta-isomerase [Microbacterium mangrovi]|uniref:Isopentenyl-diphosphate Delta-isomerase n=1 Tax=Microbacterium mangrovi TaxID=1348253 RepID=A0A0B2AAF4_9MICO|nr:isopentenyl-diphosphate Delta-isomerase [Microbacterium mangrovi]KHK98718.1 isopentenyl-diphosphate delta-isomerase [Microbacterium mangrovi]
MPDPIPELVVLTDDDGNPIGAAAKDTVHGARTPLHLAFSCYLRNASGEVLITRRALEKATWPGVWTNSFCGHPAPGEQQEAAVHRRAGQELGAEITRLRLVLPRFRYVAVDARGVMENEICPVYVADLDGPFTPSPNEVSEWAWISPADLRAAIASTPFVFSPWMREQVVQLSAAGVLEGVLR